MKYIKPSTRSFSVQKCSSQLTIDSSASTSITYRPAEEGFSLSQFKTEEIECLNRLRAICREKNLPVSNQTIYRFAIFHGFNVKRTSRAIAKRHDHPYLNLRLEEELAHYIQTKMVIFPLPGLKSAIGSEVIYSHPSRHLPSASANELIVESLCYGLNSLNRTVDQCRNGILMFVNMDGYRSESFHLDTAVRLNKITTGDVIPASTVQVLLVNPPPFFEKVWKLIRPVFAMLGSKRIHLIKDSNKLGDYLMEGYEEYLPDDFVGIGRNERELVENWLLDRKTCEESL